MKNAKDLPMYLVCCIAAPSDRPRACDSTCPYYVLEEVHTEYNVLADVENDGVKYWAGCDYEQINKDAAEYIKLLEAEVEACTNQ